MIKCEICGASFKTAQGLAGHQRLRHGDEQQQFRFPTGQELHRKVLQRVTDKIADRIAQVILEEHGKQLIESCMEEFSRQGFGLHPSGIMEQAKKAIILAAGRSSRLFPFNSDRPDCLLDVGGKTILERELETLQSCGISHIVVVRGYQKEKINYPLIRYYENSDFATSGILKSLFCAEHEINGELVLCYGNIIYEMNILRKLLRDEADISLVIDTNWLNRYRRYERPVEEATLVTVEGKRITKIGRHIIEPEEAHGEFFGLAKFSSKGAQILRTNYAKVTAVYKEKPFHTSPSIEKAYFKDMIQELINQGYTIHNVDIRGGWIEVDTVENLERAKAQTAASRN